LIGAIAIGAPWAMDDPAVVRLRGAAEAAFGDVRYAFTLPISSSWGPRVHPTTGAVDSYHEGIDIPLPVGTPVLAVWPGEIERIDVDGEGRGEINGNAIILRCGAFRLCYLHLSAVFVKERQSVQKAQIIGHVGRTGRVTGAHLHFQVYWGERSIDPLILYPNGLFSRR